jgi:hypothetical protein
VAARLLDVDVLAGRTRQDGGGGMPVIRRGDVDGIDAVIVEDAAQIADSLRGLANAIDPADGGGGLAGVIAVDVANVRDGGVGLPGERLGDSGAAAAGADDAEVQVIAGLILGDDGGREGGAGRRGHQKVAAIDGTRHGGVSMGNGGGETVSLYDATGRAQEYAVWRETAGIFCPSGDAIARINARPFSSRRWPWTLQGSAPTSSRRFASAR